MRYIGSKLNLLEAIEQVIGKHATGQEAVFVDLFAGTNVVGRYFKTKYGVISNDMLYFSYLNAKATIENNKALSFTKLTDLGISSPLDYLQKLGDAAATGKSVGYYERSYSPTGGAMYFTVENAKRIDVIRDTIQEWRNKELLTETEHAYLVSSLIEAIPYISNITGTYGAFLKKWDKRALKPLSLRPLVVTNNQRVNRSYNVDSNQLVTQLEADIVYIDTPYNNRQYASNYHVIENIARHTKPELKGTSRIFDWSTLKSDYATKKNAFAAMEDLISKVKAEHVVISYSNEGIIPEEQFEELLKKYSIDNTVEVIKLPYRKYKSKVSSAHDNLYEIIYYISTSKSREKSPDVQMNQAQNEWAAPINSYIKSPVNYVGGKFRLLNQLLPHFPQDIDTFVDLFSGGANVGINVPARKHIFNDMNYIINDMFRAMISSDPDDLVKEIRKTIVEHGLSKTDEESYRKFRDLYNSDPDPIKLYVLSSFSYNYQFRFNNDLKYNNPFGRNRSQFSDSMEKNLRRFIQRVQSMDAVFVDGYFEDFDYSQLNRRDFVYLDPPYILTTGSYNDGNRGFRNWGTPQEEAMYEVLRDLNDRGIRFALSNVLKHKGKSHELLKEFVATEGFYVYDLDFSYNNSSYNTKSRNGSREVLVTNYLSPK